MLGFRCCNSAFPCAPLRTSFFPLRRRHIWLVPSSLQQHHHQFGWARNFTIFAMGSSKRRQERPAKAARNPVRSDEPGDKSSSSTSPPHQNRSSSKGLELPAEVAVRLGTLKNDVIDSLLDKNAVPSEVISSLMSGIGGTTFSKALKMVPSYNQSLQRMAKYYFETKGGKLIRPTVSLLMSAACNRTRRFTNKPSSDPNASFNDILPTSSISVTSNCTDSSTELHRMARPPVEISLNQYRIAMVAEMIHNATLVHDDVIDESDTRRGQPTVNALWGNKQAVLVGDFILARATKVLCSIGKPDVIETMAEIVEDLVKGELLQLNGPTTSGPEHRFNHYMVKTFYKTGSLFANSCRSVAMLSENCNDALLERATEFGRNLGLAFQLVDDILDYSATEDAMGKPTSKDLQLGLATCPVLFAAEEHPELNSLIERRFCTEGDVEMALRLVNSSRGLANSRQLAREHGEKAIQCANQLLPEGDVVRDCLVDLVRRQLDRDR